MINLINVTKYYRARKERHYVLKDISYTFPKNKSIGILGANGAGKSTLLRLLGGIESPNFGKIEVEESISWPVGLTAGFVSILSGRQNVKFVCRIYNKNKNQTEDIVNYVDNFAELGKFFDMPIRTYSSGMRSRLNFGLSMAFNFDYYLVDEVTGVGDPAFKKKAQIEFEKKRDNAKIIMVSHSIDHLKQNVDMGIFLKSGNIKIFQNIDDAIAVYKDNN